MTKEEIIALANKVTTQDPYMTAFRQCIVALAGGANSVYLGTLTQATTAAPAIAILQNTLGGVPTIARTGAGVYTLTLTSAFGSATNKLFASPITYIDSAGTLTVMSFARTSANVCTITTTTNAGVAKDALTPTGGIDICINVFA
jgi:hypothetical protein